jgi:hypothetical protein
MMRTFACSIFVVGITTNLFARENTPTVGDQIFVTMTGDVAKEFHRLTSSEKDEQPKSGLSIHTSATIASTGAGPAGGAMKATGFSCQSWLPPARGRW